MTMDTATERTGPIGTLILITDGEMRDILTHIAGAGDRVLFDRLHDRWTSLRYGTQGYRASGAPGAPLRPTRDQAIADQCAHYTKTKQSTPEGKPLS